MITFFFIYFNVIIHDYDNIWVQWIKIFIVRVQIKHGDRGRGRSGKFISFPCNLFFWSFLFKSFHDKCLSIYSIILIIMIIQPNVHSCVFFIFTHFSVYVLYNVPLELYNVPLDTKMAAFKSSHFSLAYTGRRDSIRFPPDTFGIYFIYVLPVCTMYMINKWKISNYDHF